ncbi:MAG: right-handed parallel beta-helix repeat-containing protein [Planctomycetota bacterium]
MRAPILPTLVGLLVISTLAGAGHSQTIWNVPTPASSIQAALNLANSGDVIQVGAGTWTENLDYLGKDVRVSGQGPGVTILDAGNLGPGVRFASGEGPGAILEGFTVQSGRADLFCHGTNCDHAGGGIFVFGAMIGGVFPVTAPTVRNCEITGCFGAEGSAVFVYGWSTIEMLDVDITGCSNFDPLGVWTLPPNYGVTIRTGFNSTASLRRVNIENNLHAGATIAAGSGGPALIEDCRISGNTGNGLVLLGDSHVVRRTRITNNSAISSGAGIVVDSGTPNLPVLIEDCLVANNSAGSFGGAFYSGSFGYADIRGSTIYGNSAPVGSLIRGNGFVSFSFRNCILRGHGPNPIDFVAPPSIASATYEFCCVEGGAIGPGNFDLDPLFVDVVAGDFHLDPLSPCVDAGSNALFSSSSIPPRDGLDKDLRPLFGTTDIGVDECSFVGLSPTMRGDVLDASGARVDLLAVNGSFGDAARRVPLGLAQTLSFSMAAPPGAAGSKPFAIFGAIGIPDLAAKTALPFGIGTMAFAPCPLVPFWNDVFFTLTNNVTPLPAGSSGLLPGALDLTDAPSSRGRRGLHPPGSRRACGWNARGDQRPRRHDRLSGRGRCSACSSTHVIRSHPAISTATRRCRMVAAIINRSDPAVRSRLEAERILTWRFEKCRHRRVL